MKWDEKTKEKIAYIFAAAAFVVGWGITIAGFVVEPTGEIHDSVLWVLGQALVFAATVLGFALQLRNGMKTMQAELTKHIEEKMQNMGKDKAE